MRTIGIIGGMGPLATVDLYAKIVYAAQGKKDGDHVPVLLSGRPDIPDRAASICGTGPSALPALLEEARRLEQAGADALCLGCNTAHFYYNALAAAIGIPIFHMPWLAGAYCQHKRLHKVILLAAPGTYETGIYEKAFSGTGVEIIRPEPAVQRLTAQCIYEGIKACRRDYDAGAPAPSKEGTGAPASGLYGTAHCLALVRSARRDHRPGRDTGTGRSTQGAGRSGRKLFPSAALKALKPPPDKIKSHSGQRILLNFSYLFLDSALPKG